MSGGKCELLWKILCFSCYTGEFVSDRGRLLGMIQGIRGLKSGWQNGETKVMKVA